MKTILILFTVLFALSTGIAQQSSLPKEQIESIRMLIRAFKSNNKAAIADWIEYPLKREYPLKDVRNKHDFLKRFDEIFDKTFLEKVAKSNPQDWSRVGWRGIMFDNGTIWIDDTGKIVTLNYQSPKEQQMLLAAIQADKIQLPKHLQDIQKPIYLILTKHYKIRIDEYDKGNIRYSSWKINSPNPEPDIVILNGEIETAGTSGDQTITFKNEGYLYSVSINLYGSEDNPDCSFTVQKGNKTILKEVCKIKRN